MHTFQSRLNTDASIHYNGDFSGDVIVVIRGVERARIPCLLLLEFMEYVTDLKTLLAQDDAIDPEQYQLAVDQQRVVVHAFERALRQHDAKLDVLLRRSRSRLG